MIEETVVCTKRDGQITCLCARRTFSLLDMRLICEDIAAGKDIGAIAALYNRDPEHLRRQLPKIIAAFASHMKVGD